MSLLTFSRQCPFAENTPFLLLGVPGIFLVLVSAFVLDLHLHGTAFVPTISHTARQIELWFLFGEFLIIQIFFLGMCVVSGGLIAMYVVGFVLLILIMIFNPGPEDKSPQGTEWRKAHQATAALFFVYAMVVGNLAVVLPIGAFDSTNEESSLTVKRVAVVLMILMNLAFLGMIYIMAMLNFKEPERWTEPVSYLERLFMLVWFTIILLIPTGTLV